MASVVAIDDAIVRQALPIVHPIAADAAVAVVLRVWDASLTFVAVRWRADPAW